MDYINELDLQSEEKYNLKVFFNRIYKTIGDKVVTFILKNDV